MRYSTRRLNRRAQGWASIATATALTATLAGAAVASPNRAASFDLDHGNAVVDVVYGPFEQAVREVSPDGSDASLVVDSAATVEVAWFDAIAPYNPKAVGIYSSLGRRPQSEQTTRNRNIAVLYAASRALNAVFPKHAADWRAMLASAGLDPDDHEENTTTPAGLGNLAAHKVIVARTHDGMNRWGEEGGKYNSQPYADYTGYKPVNTAYELKDPSRWQPNVTSKNGIFKVQQFVTPQFGRTKPISFDTPTRLTVSPPADSDYSHNLAAYKRQADEVLAASAHLTDQQKMTAEFFNDKIFSLGVISGAAAVQAGGFDIEKTIQFIAAVDTAVFDSALATWYFKRKYDSVRPFSAIRYLYGNTKLTAWGGPGKGTVNDITGREWRSYLNTADHPEYPSTSAAICSAFAEAAKRYLGSDTIDITLTRPKGSSLIEPGVTPATDITLHWSSWSSMAKDCAMSRVWGGVHFLSAIQNVAQYAPQVGDLAYGLIARKLNGG